MRRRPLFSVLGVAVVAIPLVATLSASPVQGVNAHANAHAVCARARVGFAFCSALVVADQQGSPQATIAPTGLSPSTINAVYGFPGTATAGAGKTIAIVDAYNDPTAESDLATFSAQYGLPACTTANGCFTKVNQSGGANYPGTDSGWALEISLDVQWAHAVAPGAKILLVEASSNSFADLMTAESYATAHAQYVSNSWGGSEFSAEFLYDSYFVRSGVSVFVAAGDAGLPAEWPSSSPNVISVGGTTLNFNQSGVFTSETGWSSGGGGCSAFETATAAQASFPQYGQAGCGTQRATPDVSLDADPNSGVSVYDSTTYSGQTGWWQVGGTSASTPMWAGAAADAGAVVNAAYVYANNITFRDITSGNNGAACLVGFDLCSGRGSWLYSSGTTTTTTTAPTTTTTSTTTTVPLSTTTTTTTTVPSTTTSVPPTTTTVPPTTTTVPVSTTTTVPGLTAPTYLRASSTHYRHVNLSWSESTPGVTFNIYRGNSSGTEILYRTGVTSTSFLDNSVISGRTYYYFVTAVQSFVESGRSNEASVTSR